MRQRRRIDAIRYKVKHKRFMVSWFVDYRRRKIRQNETLERDANRETRTEWRTIQVRWGHDKNEQGAWRIRK